MSVTQQQHHHHPVGLYFKVEENIYAQSIKLLFLLSFLSFNKATKWYISDKQEEDSSVRYDERNNEQVIMWCSLMYRWFGLS